MANEKLKTEKEIEKKEEKMAERKEEAEKETGKVEKVAEKTKQQKVVKPKKEMHEAVVNAKDLPISTKHAIAICRLIKNNSIEEAIARLEKIARKKLAVPFFGAEIPHRKGMMSGRYPVNAARQFIKLLRSLAANASINGLELAKVRVIAKADTASRTRYSRRHAKFKRTGVMLIAKEISGKEDSKENKEKHEEKQELKESKEK